jgi:uncharacterized protein (TIGR00251 family)
MGLKIEPAENGVVLSVKVVPGASRDRIVGPLGDALKIAVSAAPEGGKANQAVLGLLAEHLGIARNQMSILSGHTQPRKRVFVQAVSVEQARAKLER